MNALNQRNAKMNLKLEQNTVNACFTQSTEDCSLGRNKGEHVCSKAEHAQVKTSHLIYFIFF